MNDLIKTVVCHHEEVFAQVDGGVVYEKSILEDWYVVRHDLGGEGVYLGGGVILRAGRFPRGFER